MTIGIIPFIATWLILAVLIYWFAGGQTNIFGHQSIQQDCFPKPTAAYDGLCVQSFFYYDVFLITNQRAISFSLTAFFLYVLANPTFAVRRRKLG